jgi:hypothetical protein
MPSKSNLIRFVLLVALIAGAYSCQSNGAESKIIATDSTGVKDTLQLADSAKVEVVPAATGSYFDEVAALISGVKQTGKLAAWHDSTVWSSHREFIDKNWAKVEKNRLVPMAGWTNKEMSAISQTISTAFYPFSGPDFMTVNAFFPQASKVIMLGLEPVGALPKVEKFNKEESTDYSENLKRSLTEIFERSYFITEYMLRDFQRQKVNGTLPVICFFMKRSGHVIDSLHYIVKTEKGTLQEVDYADNVKAIGVRVTCHKAGLVKNVYYFKYDVSNQYFNDTAAFFKFVKANVANAATYIKSASYVLHANFMSNMKKMILSGSNVILQDDTGIPYDEIAGSGGWNIKLFGEYSQPIKNFPYLRMQKSIMAAYEKDTASVPKLPFHLGYHWTTGKDVLMLATKIK